MIIFKSDWGEGTGSAYIEQEIEAIPFLPPGKALFNKPEGHSTNLVLTLSKLYISKYFQYLKVFNESISQVNRTSWSAFSLNVLPIDVNLALVTIQGNFRLSQYIKR